MRYDASLTGYTEGDGAKVIDGLITITDPDSTNMASATIQITGNYQNGEDVTEHRCRGFAGSRHFKLEPDNGYPYPDRLCYQG